MYSSIVTFNVNGLNNVSKRKSIFNYFKQKDFDITLPQKKHFTFKTANCGKWNEAVKLNGCAALTIAEV